MFTATGRMPTWIAVGPLGWARLGGLTDLAGRPIFPALNPVERCRAPRTSPANLSIAGMRVIVSRRDHRRGHLHGQQRRHRALLVPVPAADATEPSLLGQQLAVAASLGSYKPPTTEAGPSNTPPAKYEAIVKIGD